MSLAAARTDHQREFEIFSKARDDYRNRKINDAEFIAAKKRYERAGAIYDAAIEAEANKPAEKPKKEKSAQYRLI